MVCGNVLTGQQKEYDGFIKHVIASRCWLIFFNYSWPYLPSQNFFLLKMAISEKGAAIQGAAGLAKMLEIRCLILHSRNRLDLTYRKFLSKRNKKFSFLILYLYTKLITICLIFHNLLLICKLKYILALFCDVFHGVPLFLKQSNTEGHWFTKSFSCLENTLPTLEKIRI